MKDLIIVIPVKDPGHAKERLMDFLSPAQRKELALALFEQVLSTLQTLPGSIPILVVTDSSEVAALAGKFQAVALKEEKASGETAAVEKAAAWSVRNGFVSQLVIPGDMAALERDDLLRLLRQPRENPSVILCPATGDDGTNAILTTPPNALRFRFGPRSFPDYQRQARDKNIPCEVIRLPSLVLDLDTPEDVRSFLGTPGRTAAHHLLTEWTLLKKS